MKKPLHPVSDHAVLRYLERVKGVDIEAIRCRIGKTVDIAIEHDAGAVVSGGYRYILGDNGVVVTVEGATRTAINIGSFKRRREIE